VTVPADKNNLNLIAKKLVDLYEKLLVDTQVAPCKNIQDRVEIALLCRERYTADA